MYHTIKTLRALGKTQRYIAEELGISKTTVNKYCNLSDEEGEICCQTRVHKSVFSVDEEYILQRLEQYPNLRLSRLYEEVLERHPEITATERAFRKYVHSLRKNMEPTKQRVFAIIETKIGKQVQVDIGEMWVDCTAGNRLKVFFCCFVLSFSRYAYVHCQTRHYDTADFIEAHKQSFRFFEGVAKEYVYDQTKLVAISERYREVIYNETFHQFAVKAGFFPYVCEGYDPQSKGKIERCISEVKNGFLYAREFADLADVRSKMMEWLNKFNQRKHATTKQKPLEVWREERLVLRAIPDAFVCTLARKADKTGLISYQGNKYSVPMNFQGRRVIVEERDTILQIIDPINGNIVVGHVIPDSKGKVIKNKNHYRDLNQELKELKSVAIELLSKYDPEGIIVERLVSDNPKIPRDQLRAVCKMTKTYSESIWHLSIPIIHNLQTLKASKIEEVLQKLKFQERVNAAKKTLIQAPVAESVLQRSLNSYMEVLKK